MGAPTCTVSLVEIVVALLLFLALVVAILLGARPDVTACLGDCLATTLCIA
ncbi:MULTISPECIES: hypothetical protein [unclassified Bacillus (in: firmicutes)]|uniref:hypothetical protein n=1 Tax=unclassified Bacillus (in: firmicutes) TaxID=185979 RepID=UPI0015964540|nr:MULTISPECIES: hypothetical protein [unclassified Bacillus (in: firmicutes)]